MRDAGTHEQETGVGNARCPRIGDESDCLAAFDAGGNRLHGGVFVEFVVGEHTLLYAEVFQQYGRRARIFCQYDIGLFQHAHSAQRDIFQIPYRQKSCFAGTVPPVAVVYEEHGVFYRGEAVETRQGFLVGVRIPAEQVAYEHIAVVQSYHPA